MPRIFCGFIIFIATMTVLGQETKGGYLILCDDLDSQRAKWECTDSIINKSIQNDEQSSGVSGNGVFNVQYSISENGTIRIGNVIPMPQRIYNKKVDTEIQNLVIKHLNNFEWVNPSIEGEIYLNDKISFGMGLHLTINTDKL